MLFKGTLQRTWSWRWTVVASVGLKTIASPWAVLRSSHTHGKTTRNILAMFLYTVHKMFCEYGPSYHMTKWRPRGPSRPLVLDTIRSRSREIDRTKSVGIGQKTMIHIKVFVPYTMCECGYGHPYQEFMSRCLVCSYLIGSLTMSL